MGERTDEGRDAQLKSVADAGRPDAFVLHEAIRREGDEELRRHGGALLRNDIAAVARKQSKHVERVGRVREQPTGRRGGGSRLIIV